MRISDWSSDVCSSDLRSLAIPNAIILRGTLSLIFQLPCGTGTRRFSSALVRGPVGAGFPPVRSSDRLIRSAQGPHPQACRFVAYLIHIDRWRDKLAMNEAKDTRTHDQIGKAPMREREG